MKVNNFSFCSRHIQIVNYPNLSTLIKVQVLQFPQVKRKLWKEYFWSRSYCLLTTGGSPIEAIYEIVCLDHVIDVISFDEPIIKEILYSTKGQMHVMIR
jgi:hypothetical protein